MGYSNLDMPYDSHRRDRASRCAIPMKYVWALYTHSFSIQWVAWAFLPIQFPDLKIWKNLAPYGFRISTQPSHTIPTYGPYMAQALPYHSHTFTLVRGSNSKRLRRLL